MAVVLKDTGFRFITESEPLVFRFQTGDHPPLVFRFKTGSPDTVFRFVTASGPPLIFRFLTESAPVIFRFKVGESTLHATMTYEVSPTCKTAVLQMEMETTLPGEQISLIATYWDNDEAIRVQKAGNNWLIDLEKDGAYRVEFYSDQRGPVIMDYIFVHCSTSKRFNAYLLGECGVNDKLTEKKYQELKALRRSAFSLHKAGMFKESKAMLDQIVNLTCNDRLY